MADGEQHWLTRQDIPSGHKLARAVLLKGQPVIRYGQVIGFASHDIQPGDWVHSHNLEVGDMQREFEVQVVPPPRPSPISGRSGEGASSPLTFLGFRRKDGRVGTRNYIAVISTVSCANQSRAADCRCLHARTIWRNFPMWTAW